MLHRLPSRRRDRAADLALALELADIGSRLAFRRFAQGNLHVVEKPDGTPVSDADMAAESDIRHRLEIARPDDGVLGEEFGADGDQRSRWLIDSIDGTANFIRQDPNWAVLVALEVDGRVDVGVIDAPALGHRWWAARGLGAYADGRRIQPQPQERDLGAAVLTRRGGRSLARLDPAHPLRQLLAGAHVAEPELCWAQLLVAEGRADIDLCLDARPWDLAAGKAIVIEAGGRFTDLDGADSIETGTALVASPDLHEQILFACGSGGPSPVPGSRGGRRPTVVVLS